MAVHAIFRSADRGRSWTRSDAGLPGTSRINAFAAAGGLIFAGTDSGVYVSDTEGRKWSAASERGRILGLALAGSLLYAGTDRQGLLASPDHGITWMRISGFPSRNARCLLNEAGKLYAGTDSDGVFVTSDSGRNWIPLPTGLPAQAQIFALTAVQGTVVAGLYAKGLFAWSDLAQRWTKAGPVLPLVLAASGTRLLAGHNPGGIHWSDGLGATWSRGTGELAPEAPVWELASTDEIAFAGAATGIYYSGDRGPTWIRARTGLPRESPAVSFLLKPDLVLAGVVIPH